MRLFDEKFGAQFLDGVPSRPGVYRFYDAAGGLLYVGKAKDLRRRLGQYRTAGRKKHERKRFALVKTAARIAWEICESELAAALMEVRLIQTLSPRRNVASAFPFLYPFVGIHIHERETYFCLTTSPAAFPDFEFHGAFRSREVTGEAFFSLVRLLRFVGHPVPRHRCRQFGTAAHSYVRGFRRLPPEVSERWPRLLEGASREALESLAVRLLEHAGARAKRAEVQEDFRAMTRFFEEEASELARARAATAYPIYPVPQAERDLLFVRYRQKPFSRHHLPTAAALEKRASQENK
ncbi:MAG TPA: GIY-YIG nuclease family protein [Terriglobales bacterium]|nr:GIY-YIG nuclease family protein [Terriglobales bacterium]